MTTSVYGGNPAGFTGSHYGASGKGILGSDILARSSSGLHGAGPLVNDSLVPTSEYRWYLTSLPGAGDIKATEYGQFIFSNAPNGTYVINYKLVEDGATLAATGVLTIVVGLDITPPSLTGVITITNLSTTSYTATCPVATDDYGIQKYQYRLNNGTWNDIASASNSITILGRTPGTVDALDMRAVDTSNNVSSALSKNVSLPNIPDNLAPATYTITGFDATSYALSIRISAANSGTFLVTGFAATGLRTRVPSSANGFGLLMNWFNAISFNTSTQFVSDATSFAKLITGVDAVSIKEDIIAPPFGLTITGLTATGYTVSFFTVPGANAIAYEYSINNGRWYSIGLRKYVTISGRTPGTTDRFHLRSRYLTKVSEVVTIYVTLKRKR